MVCSRSNTRCKAIFKRGGGAPARSSSRASRSCGRSSGAADQLPCPLLRTTNQGGAPSLASVTPYTAKGAGTSRCRRGKCSCRGILPQDGLVTRACGGPGRVIGRSCTAKPFPFGHAFANQLLPPHTTNARPPRRRSPRRHDRTPASHWRRRSSSFLHGAERSGKAARLPRPTVMRRGGALSRSLTLASFPSSVRFVSSQQPRRRRTPMPASPPAHATAARRHPAHPPAAA